MKIFVIDKKYEELKKKNLQRNIIIETGILRALFTCFFCRGCIIYSAKEKKILNFFQSFFRIPYLYGSIQSIVQFENQYAKVKHVEIPILMYHQFVLKPEEGGKIKLFVTKRQFEIHLKILKLLNYNTITFEELKQIGLHNRFNKKYIILTVDDGYKDNYTILFPLLKKYKMKAVIFWVSGIKTNKWTIKSDGEKEIHLLDDSQILEMQNSGLIEFGGHTLTHPSLKKLDDIDATREIIEDKKNIERTLGKTLTAFAYPYGHRKESTKKIVEKAGYFFAVSTDTGSGIITEDYYDIRRTAIDKTSLFDFIRKISPGYLQYKAKKYRNRRR
ncbi:polysaccharide deacetylase family protein [Fusobacterium sp.]|uniref:polysaccharide deacetylase family protein n=1 Tax=Fusobacterium sp. TaxID=68766 RepID=UPI00396CFFD1